jgi:mono/diheme cytochrome c family protein
VLSTLKSLCLGSQKYFSSNRIIPISCELAKANKVDTFMIRFVKFLLLLLVVVAVSGLFSALPAAQKGSETKGRHFFKDTCRQCHAKGGVGGELTPMNKTMAQWRAYFAAGTHNHGKEQLTKYLPADELLDASTFLINHAADSPQPETCGK